MKKKIDEDFGTICVCAERYAIGRRTYMPSLVQDFIKRNINDINTGTIAVMIRDVEEAENMGYGYGDEKIDKPGWMNFLNFLKQVQKERNNNGA